jgi:hypothetical protein
MGHAQEILEAAKQALCRADAVRLAAILAVEMAQEALKLEAAGEAAELVTAATFKAAKMVKAAELAAVEAFEAAALIALDRTIAVEKTRKAAVEAMELVKCAAAEAARVVKAAEVTAIERLVMMDKARKDAGGE